MNGFGQRVAAMIVAAALVIGLATFGLVQCDKRRSEATQGRVERGQAGAASNSAADAIATAGASGARETASEDLTRSNDKEIRDAQGADARVGAGVDAAGRRSLCRRAAYRDDPKCKLRDPAAD